jgi:hypothetical protein
MQQALRSHTHSHCGSEKARFDCASREAARNSQASVSCRHRLPEMDPLSRGPADAVSWKAHAHAGHNVCAPAWGPAAAARRGSTHLLRLPRMMSQFETIFDAASDAAATAAPSAPLGTVASAIRTGCKPAPSHGSYTQYRAKRR